MYYMSYPEGYIFGFPGVYSLTAQYGNANSFYFSTYVAVTVVMLFEFRELGNDRLSISCIILTTLVSIMLVITRGHYSIDVFGGLLFGHYFWMQASWLCKHVDFRLFRIPFHKRFPNF